MKSGFNYTEYLNWVKQLDITKERFDIFLKQFLLEQAQRCVALCKKRQRAVGAIDTGAMINSWSIGSQHIELKSTGSKSKSGKDAVIMDIANSDVANIVVVGDTLQVEIYNPMEYASFIEYGQRSYQGKYILTISIDTIQKAIPGRFDKAFHEFLKQGGVI